SCQRGVERRPSPRLHVSPALLRAVPLLARRRRRRYRGSARAGRHGLRHRRRERRLVELVTTNELRPDRLAERREACGTLLDTEAVEPLRIIFKGIVAARHDEGLHEV